MLRKCVLMLLLCTSLVFFYTGSWVLFNAAGFERLALANYAIAALAMVMTVVAAKAAREGWASWPTWVGLSIACYVVFVHPHLATAERAPMLARIDSHSIAAAYEASGCEQVQADHRWRNVRHIGVLEDGAGSPALMIVSGPALHSEHWVTVDSLASVRVAPPEVLQRALVEYLYPRLVMVDLVEVECG